VTRFRSLVVCYHAASAEWDQRMSIAPGTIERQIRLLLLRGYAPASAEVAVLGVRRVVHVTFDDAYTSVEGALPGLTRLGVPVTIFACTNYADDGAPLTVPELAGEDHRQLATMAWPKLRELAERGVEIGSHTVSHAHLTALSDEEMRRELVESKQCLEDELGRPCRYLAYPYGDEDPRVRQAAAAAGYEAGFALPGSRARPERMRVPRVGFYRGDSLFRATLKSSELVRRPLERIVGY
jgi:peptidoglycan/xylan/chitin deacetylase (PgdA/CDA1 family)